MLQKKGLVRRGLNKVWNQNEIFNVGYSFSNQKYKLWSQMTKPFGHSCFHFLRHVKIVRSFRSIFSKPEQIKQWNIKNIVKLTLIFTSFDPRPSGYSFYYMSWEGCCWNLLPRFSLLNAPCLYVYYQNIIILFPWIPKSKICLLLTLL